MFLLKGHEDLRLDERVMQLFGLVNTLLANNRKTSNRFVLVPLHSSMGPSICCSPHFSFFLIRDIDSPVMTKHTLFSLSLSLSLCVCVHVCM
jgi:hypothetical protein